MTLEESSESFNNEGKSLIEPKDIFQIALQTRNFEISNFWQRSNYFLVLNSGIGIGFFQIHDIFYTRLLAAIGLVVSILWLMVALGSKFWQIHWEQKLQKVEESYVDLGLMTSRLGLFRETVKQAKKEVRDAMEKEDPNRLKRFLNALVLTKPSVTVAMTCLPLIFMLVWCVVIWHGPHGNVPDAERRECVNVVVADSKCGAVGIKTESEDLPNTIISSDSGGKSASNGVFGLFRDLLYLLLLIGVGWFLYSLGVSRLTRASGVVILSAASILSGMKMFDIKELNVFKDIKGEFKFDPKIAVGSKQGVNQLRLPPFPSGLDEPDEKIKCAVEVIKSVIDKSNDISLIIVSAGSDRQSLKPELVEKYGSNWALSQRRAIRIQKLILGSAVGSIPSVPIGIAPTRTESGQISNWNIDREPFVTIVTKDESSIWQGMQSRISAECN